MENVPFHPLVARWFTERFGAPTAPQAAGWSHIASGRDTLIAAPTGSGKTLAAFLWAIDRLIASGARGPAAGASSAGPLPVRSLRGAKTEGPLEDLTRVVYISPLKALANDI